jgi:hypothetical protein
MTISPARHIRETVTLAKQSKPDTMTRARDRRCRRISARTAARAACFVLLLMTISAPSNAEPLEYNGFASLKFEAFFSRIDGRMGLAQNVSENGTVIDFINDMGLPTDNRTFRLSASVRPLEHHLLRVYGSIPELYRGGTIVQRTLQTKSFTYPAGTPVQSQLNVGTFGFGYDLDFLVGPRWFGGMQGELKFINLRATISAGALQQEDTISLNELVPCLGAHVQTRIPWTGRVNVGGFARITYGVTPNFLNHVDLSTGLCLGMGSIGSVLAEAKVGYELESFYHNQENLLGRSLELKREGIVFSLEAAF